MSASNFYTANAKGIYAIDSTLYYDAEEECYTDEYIPGADTVEKGAFDVVIDDITGGEQEVEGFSTSCFNNKYDDNRSYPGLNILEKTVNLHGIYVKGLIILRAGYYSGYNLDWTVQGDGMEYESAEDFAADVVSLYMEDNHGEFSETEKEAARKEYIEAYKAMADACDNFCKTRCETVLECVCIASNGEAFYKPAK